jgi:roadblock/LC7 domain-containing protein
MKEEAYALIKAELTAMATAVAAANSSMANMVEAACESFWKLNYNPIIGEGVLDRNYL